MKTLKILVTLLIFTMLLTATAVMASSDDYIQGYAEAVLEKEFHLSPAVLRVENGIITVRLGNIEKSDREKIVSELSRIEGVRKVEVILEEARESEHVLIVDTEESGELTGKEISREALSPSMKNRLFQPLIADPRWPHFSLAYQFFINDEELKSAGSTSFGETLPFYRTSAPFGGQWEIGIQAAVFALFDLDSESLDLINADYWVGIPLSYRREAFSSLLRLFHQSSHLGDEFLLRNRTDRINLSYEGLDLKVSYESSELMRLYVGSGVIMRKEPEDLKRWSFQYGFELNSPWTLLAGKLKPIAGADFKNREESDWDIDKSLRLGFEVESRKMLWNRLNLLFEYFNGHSPHGQFYERSIQYLSLGSHFYF
jgi:hypothetical protein